MFVRTLLLKGYLSFLLHFLKIAHQSIRLAIVWVSPGPYIIAGRTITVSKRGSVNGSLGADTVVISGAVSGLVEASKIEVLSTAYVTGELRYDRLSVNPGAYMEARCTPSS